jgi:hypothetical protein
MTMSSLERSRNALFVRELGSACRTKALKVAPLLLAASLGVLSGCSSNSDGSDGSASALSRSKVKVTPTKGGGSTTTVTPPTTVTTTAVAYDTTIGAGVDAYGYANLPLRSGAHRYFVNSATGADGNGCSGGQQPGTPLKTIAAASACIQGGNGDQVLVAEGTRYSEGLPNLDARAGFDAQYPTVIES